MKQACWITMVLVGLGCGSQPVSKAVLPGSSITLAIGGDDNPGFNPLRGPIGYGSELHDGAFGPDEQRGEIEVRLLDGSAEGFPLNTRMTFRIYPDPASDAGITEVVHPLWAPGVGVGLAMAMVDIPLDAPPSTTPYPLQVRTVRRDAAGSVVEVLNDMTHDEQTLTILDPAACGVSGSPTPNDALMLDFYVEDVSALFPAFTPHPKVLLDLFPGAHPSTPPLPAAAHLELDYPAGVSIRTVFEDRGLGRTSLVSWRDDPAAQRLTIDLVSPDEKVRYLAVAFDSGAVVDADDFVVDDAATVLYDGDGQDMARLARPVAIQ